MSKLNISLEGRIDSNNAPIVEQELFEKIDGQTENVSLAAADQIRVSLSYARNACEEDGEIIDIRQEHMRLFEGPIPCTTAVNPEDLDAYLENKDFDTRLYFICSYGSVADQAAWHAYGGGFRNARSLGGHHEGLHID